MVLSELCLEGGSMELAGLGGTEIEIEGTSRVEGKGGMIDGSELSL